MADYAVGDWVSHTDDPDKIWQIWAHAERSDLWLTDGFIFKLVRPDALTRREEPQ